MSSRRQVALHTIQQAKYIKFILNKKYTDETAGIWVDVHGCDVIRELIKAYKIICLVSA